MMKPVKRFATGVNNVGSDDLTKTRAKGAGLVRCKLWFSNALPTD